MKSSMAAVALSSLLSACAGMVTANDGSQVTVEHDMWVSPESASEVARSACEQQGKPAVQLVATANKNPRFGKGGGVQLSTFKCVGG